MYFGADYYPEHWVYPFDGTEEAPESRWEKDAEMMKKAHLNVVRMGEFSWGLCETEEGKYDFGWLKRAVEVMNKAGIKVILGTPTAAPPVWLLQKHPEILPIDENGLRRHEGTRRAYCMNSDVYWDFSERIVRKMAEEFGNHPAVIGWQIDNGVGRHNTEYSFNAETKRDWHAWLKEKYETIERLNERLGLRVWGQVVTDWDQVPMPMRAPAVHNPALLTDWRRFSSDTCVAYVKMQADILHELSPDRPVTTTMRAFGMEIDHFDLAEAVDFVSVDSHAAIGERAAENAMSMDLLRCLKREGAKSPGGEDGFWVMEQKAGSASWGDVHATVRPGVVRMFTYQLISRGADGVCYFFWRQPRIGPEKYYGGILNHKGTGDNRMYEEITQLGEEIDQLRPLIQGSHVQAEACILVNFENHWAQNQELAPNRHFNQLDHILKYYTALYTRHVLVDFARPIDDLSQYKLVIAPSLHMLAPGEADRLALYVYNGGTLIGTCNSALVDEHHMSPVDGYPAEMQELFGLEVKEFDILPPEVENSMNFKGTFTTSRLHPGKLWCDIIEPKECQVLGNFTKEYYAGSPCLTVNDFGAGKAIYVGTTSHQEFYYDLIQWVRTQVNLYSIIKVPETVEVSMRRKDNSLLYFLINHQDRPVRIQFLKQTHDFLTGKRFSGNYDMPPNGVLVLDEKIR